MHPPPFRPDNRLSDWPDCRLGLTCCRGAVLLPVRLLIAWHGDAAFGRLLTRLRYGQCGGKPKADLSVRRAPATLRRRCGRLGNRVEISGAYTSPGRAQNCAPPLPDIV